MPSKNMNLFRAIKLLLCFGTGLSASTMLVALLTPTPIAVSISVLIATVTQAVVLTTLHMCSLDEQED